MKWLATGFTMSMFAASYALSPLSGHPDFDKAMFWLAASLGQAILFADFVQTKAEDNDA